MRIVLSLLLCVATPGCGGDDTAAEVCPDEPVRVLSTAQSAVGLTTAFARDAAYYTLHDADFNTSLFIGPTCGDEAVPIVRGVTFTPARVHLDPRDDDPAFACDRYGQFFTVDLHGERAPTLLLPSLDCEGTPSAHGLLLGSVYASPPEIWLFPDFPDEGSARQIAEGRVLRVIDDAVIYTTPDGLRRLDLDTGVDRSLIDGDPLVISFSATHILWIDPSAGQVQPVHLLELATAEQTQVGELDTLAPSVHGSQSVPSWWLDGSGRHVVHAPLDDGPPQVHDLAGRPVPFAVRGSLARTELEDGTYLSYADDEHMFASRIGASEVVPLARACPRTAQNSDTSASMRFPGRLECASDGDRHVIPLDGGPAITVLDVGPYAVWLDEDHLLVQNDRELVNVHAPSGTRTVVARDVVDVRSAGTAAVDGVHVLLAREGGSEVWHHPPSALMGASAPGRD